MLYYAKQINIIFSMMAQTYINNEITKMIPGSLAVDLVGSWALIKHRVK